MDANKLKINTSKSQAINIKYKLISSVAVEPICFETKTRSRPETFFETKTGRLSRPRPEVIETKTETGNYSASKNKSTVYHQV